MGSTSVGKRYEKNLRKGKHKSAGWTGFLMGIFLNDSPVVQRSAWVHCVVKLVVCKVRSGYRIDVEVTKLIDGRGKENGVESQG